MKRSSGPNIYMNPFGVRVARRDSIRNPSARRVAWKTTTQTQKPSIARQNTMGPYKRIRCPLELAFNPESKRLWQITTNPSVQTRPKSMHPDEKCIACQTSARNLALRKSMGIPMHAHHLSQDKCEARQSAKVVTNPEEEHSARPVGASSLAKGIAHQTSLRFLIGDISSHEIRQTRPSHHTPGKMAG